MRLQHDFQKYKKYFKILKILENREKNITYFEEKC